MSTLKPIYLFADSQLLFWKDEDDQLFLDRIRKHIDKESPKAAYVGVSNGDKPEFYELFLAAMESIGITDCRMIKSDYSRDDKKFLNRAHIILLAGGDVEQGWNVMNDTGMKTKIIDRYSEGTLLIGISAGAVQLGTTGWREGELSKENLIDTSSVVPFTISVHDEQENWDTLKKVIKLKGGYDKGIGVPSGGGMVYHTDHTVEPIRHPLTEFTNKDDELVSHLLFPGEGVAEEDEPEVEFGREPKQSTVIDGAFEVMDDNKTLH